MNVGSERSVSYWQRTATVEDAPPLGADQSTDVVIIGAGIAGLSTAYELAKAGRQVMVLDRGALGNGMTARTTAHLASELDDYYHELIRLLGLEQARLTYESQAAAIDRIADIGRAESIDCDFRRLDAFLFEAPGSAPGILEQEIEAARQVGLRGVEWVERAPLPGLDTGRCLRFPDQGRFHPLKYLGGLIRCIRRDGGTLFGNTAVVSVDEESDAVIVKTEAGHAVRAQAAVVASNSPINDKVAIHSKQAPYRTYVIAAPVPRGAVTDALYWDTLDPYHYVRLQPSDAEEDVLIIGGEDHKTGEADNADARFASLEAWARQRFPRLRPTVDRWSGQVMEPVDYVPYIGRNHGNSRVFVATGDSGQGITNGVAASILLRDLILGRENPWAEVFNPRRVTMRAAGEFMKESIDVAARLAERLIGGEVSSLDEVARGQGAVVRHELGKLAVYRDEGGTLHVRSAVCTHVGCVVHWNSFERCWDCPCHGSQFAIDGAVLNGPTVQPLQEVDATKPDEDGARQQEARA